MSTQSSSNQISLHLPNPEKSLQFRQVEESESENLFHDHIQGEDENAEDVQMADHLRPMEELLRIPILGYENAKRMILLTPVPFLADEFELKTELLDFVSNNPFFGFENNDPHSHIKRFNQITRTLRLNQVLDDVVKLILFPFSLKGAAETWLENEPPNSITSWDDLVSKFLNQFFPHSKTRELRKEITNFQQAGGILMSKNTHEALNIIENKAKSVSHHEEFANELANIISPSEYDYFYFDLEADPGEFTRVLKGNIFDLSTKGLTINELNDSSLLLSDCDSSLSKEFSDIDLLVSFPFGNEDMIFDPGIFIIKRVQSKRFQLFPLDDFPTFSFVSDSLLLTDPSEIETFLSFPSRNKDKVFDPGILIIDGVFSSTRKYPHLLINNFMIDKYHIFSEISLMTESSVSFHPKDKEIRGESS
ncbi:reverse transcriptase domain-containing protein [Tanacetum coccineum]